MKLLLCCTLVTPQLTVRQLGFHMIMNVLASMNIPLTWLTYVQLKLWDFIGEFGSHIHNISADIITHNCCIVTPLFLKFPSVNM